MSELCRASITRMGFRALEGSWLEGQDALVSTAVGALTFWLLGAVVGLLVRTRLYASACDALSRIRRERVKLQAYCEGTTAQNSCVPACSCPGRNGLQRTLLWVHQPSTAQQGSLCGDCPCSSRDFTS